MKFNLKTNSKLNIKLLVICIAIPLAVGFLASLLTRNGIDALADLHKPPLAPPDWLFPIVWTILYILMGFASYLILSSDSSQEAKTTAIQLYAAQLVVNFLWSIIFFNLNWYFTAFIVILLLWTLIFFTINAFLPISKTAAYLLIPYIIWVSFAAYLNLGIWILN